MNKLIKLFTLLDWLVGGVSLVLGLYLKNGWLIAGGFVGFASAYFKPAERAKTYLEKKLLRKQSGHADTAAVLAEDAFYAEMLKTAEPASDPVPVHFGGALPAGALFLSNSRHNQVKREHFNLAPDSHPRHWA